MNTKLILLDKHRIQSRLKNRLVKLEVLEKITSTNHYLKALSNGNQDMRACLAETQTAGKGRLQRQWHSPFGENIYLSLLYPFKQNLSALNGLSLIISLAVCRAIESVIDLKSNVLQIKWPNDILLNGKKLAGILVEIQSETNGLSQLIIGVGINVNMNKLNQNDIDQPWTSLINTLKQYVDRNLLAPEIIDTLIDHIETFLSQGLSSFHPEWMKRDYLTHSQISLVSAGQIIHGLYSGINEHGHLTITNSLGERMTFSSGDASILKKPIKK